MVILAEIRQCAGKEFKAKIVFVSQAISPALDDSDIVVKFFPEAHGDLVLGLAVSHNAFPVTFNHRGEVLERLKALPLQGELPVAEEAGRK